MFFNKHMKQLKNFIMPAIYSLLFSLSLSQAGLANNPIVSHVYTADPAARVFNDRVYVMVTHDQDTQSDYSQLVDYYLFSSDDMVNWQDHGIVWNSPQQTSWASLAYAPDIIERGGKYYLYFPNGASSIGVAVADKPEGPYVDPLGRALVDRTTPNGNVDWVFDPGVFIDDDGQAYLYFGGGGEGMARVIRLNEDMISTSGSAISIDVPNFFEALYMHKHNGTYYLSYSSNVSTGLQIQYMTSSNPISGFTHRGTLLENPWENNYNNNHQSIIQYKGQWYVFYHNRAIANARGDTTYQRSINVDRLYHNEDGSISLVNASSIGVPQLKTVDAFAINQAEMMDNESGIETEAASEGSQNIMMGSGDWVKISQLDFGSGVIGFQARVAGAQNSGLEIILDDINNDPIASLSITSTGGWQSWQTQSVSFTGIQGVHDLYLRATGYHNLNWYQFLKSDVGSNTLEIELESLQYQSSFSPLTIGYDSAASGGQFIEWSNNGSDQYFSTPSDDASGKLAISFQLTQTTDLMFQIQANMPSAVDDSFYYKLDDGPWMIQNNQRTSGWSRLAPTTFTNLSSGQHTLYLLRREDGAQLDKVILEVAFGQIM